MTNKKTYKMKIRRLLKIYELYDALEDLTPDEIESSDIIGECDPYYYEDEYNILEDAKKYIIFRNTKRSTKMPFIKTGIGYVYFILDESKGVVKIGSTITEINHRLKTLQVGNGSDLKLKGYLIINNGKVIERERELQRLFKQYRTCGEWFVYSKEIEEYVNIHCEKEINNDKKR